jgi:hypothetical protein
MDLGTLLTEIRMERNGVTVEELSKRLAVSKVEVRAMLDALRASSMLGPVVERAAGTDECSSSGACGSACRGPSECPFVVDVGATLELRPVAGVRNPEAAATPAVPPR